MRRLSLQTKIFMGMIAGIVTGVVVQNSGLEQASIAAIVSYIKPIGDVFLRMIFMMVIPLIMSGLALGVADLGSLRKVGRIGWRTLTYTVLVSAMSVLLGIALVTIFSPGGDISAQDRQLLIEKYRAPTAGVAQAGLAGRSIGEILSTIVPKNPFEDMVRAFDPTYSGGGLLAIMFFTLMVGMAMTVCNPEKVKAFRNFLEGLYEVTMKVIDFGMRMAPIGVAALLFTLTASFGFSMIAVLLKFVLVVLLALAIHQFVTYSLLLKFLGKMSPVFFFRNIGEVMTTAFSTSSSNATLPTALRVTIEKLKVPRDISQFVLTIGSTANQNGTALYEGVTVLFLAQCFGIHLDLAQQILVILLSVLGGVGTAGVPGGSLPIIAMILTTVGIPAEGIAIIYGVDRLLDMSRTVLNVTGDMTAAVYVSRSQT